MEITQQLYIKELTFNFDTWKARLYCSRSDSGLKTKRVTHISYTHHAHFNP